MPLFFRFCNFRPIFWNILLLKMSNYILPILNVLYMYCILLTIWFFFCVSFKTYWTLLMENYLLNIILFCLMWKYHNDKIWLQSLLSWTSTTNRKMGSCYVQCTWHDSLNSIDQTKWVITHDRTHIIDNSIITNYNNARKDLNRRYLC